MDTVETFLPKCDLIFAIKRHEDQTARIERLETELARSVRLNEALSEALRFNRLMNSKGTE